MDNLLAARALMGLSLCFHIIYASVGVGLPVLLMLAEGISLRTDDESYHALARRWIRPASVLFAIGAVSGTILSFELGFLWPRFMALSGPLIGFAFWMEGFAFFTEAIFLALYSYGERRLSRRALFLCTVAITVSAAASALFVISANSWMNTPYGFALSGGNLVDLNPVRAFLNPAWAHEAAHGTLAAYVATGFAVAGIDAAAMLRGETSLLRVRSLRLSLGVACVCLPLMLFTGDWAADFLADWEKPKLAAMEALFHSAPGAPIVIGGWPDLATREVHYGIKIPKLLSILAHHDPNAMVTGLDAFPAENAPDPRLVHLFFDLMVGSFFVMFAAGAWSWWRVWHRKQSPPGRRQLWAILAASPFGMIALEAGWLVTEFGRQPWAARGLMRVQQGVTPNGGLLLVFGIFLAVYLALTIGLLRLLFAPSREDGHVDA